MFNLLSISYCALRLAVVTKIFEDSKYIPEDEKNMASQVTQKGDLKEDQNNDAALKELVAYENTLKSSRLSNTSKGRQTEQAAKTVSDAALKDLKDDLRTDVDTSIQENLASFTGKFELYQRQLRDELEKFIHEESDRVIVAVTEGPHNRVKNAVRMLSPCVNFLAFHSNSYLHI